MLIFVETLKGRSQQRVSRIEERRDQDEKAVRANFLSRGSHLIGERLKGGHLGCRTDVGCRTIEGTLRMSKLSAESSNCNPLRIGRAAIMTWPAVAAWP